MATMHGTPYGSYPLNPTTYWGNTNAYHHNAAIPSCQGLATMTTMTKTDNSCRYPSSYPMPQSYAVEQPPVDRNQITSPHHSHIETASSKQSPQIAGSSTESQPSPVIPMNPRYHNPMQMARAMYQNLTLEDPDFTNPNMATRVTEHEPEKRMDGMNESEVQPQGGYFVEPEQPPKPMRQRQTHEWEVEAAKAALDNVLNRTPRQQAILDAYETNDESVINRCIMSQEDMLNAARNKNYSLLVQYVTRWQRALHVKSLQARNLVEAMVNQSRYITTLGLEVTFLKQTLAEVFEKLPIEPEENETERILAAEETLRMPHRGKISTYAVTAAVEAWHRLSRNEKKRMTMPGFAQSQNILYATFRKAAHRHREMKRLATKHRNQQSKSRSRASATT